MAKPGKVKGSPKTGGRKKGALNKASLRFRDRLESNGVDLEKTLAEAIIAKDIELIKALQQLLPYLTPRLKEQEKTTPQPPLEDQMSDDEAILLSIVAKNPHTLD